MGIFVVVDVMLRWISLGVLPWRLRMKLAEIFVKFMKFEIEIDDCFNCWGEKKFTVIGPLRF